MALEVLLSLGVNCLLNVVKYVLRLGDSFNNWPMVMIILLSNIYCPTSSSTFKEMGASSASRCSIIDDNLAHLVDQDGYGILPTSCYTSCIFSSFCNS
jgi:hypothetical protein